MPITNSTVYTVDTMVEYNRQHLRQKKSLIIIYAVATVVTLIVFALDRIISFAYGDGSLDPFLLFALIFFVTVDVFYILFYTVLLKPIVKKDPMTDAQVDYSFTDECMEDHTTAKNLTQTTSTKYDAIYKVVEGERYFYIYIAKNMAHIIDKNGFKDGSPDMLRLVLAAHVDSKKRNF